MTAPMSVIQTVPAVESKKTFPVMEIFGPVLQGEGELIGRATHFVRFGLCDYKCSWCDSMFAVDPKSVNEHATRMTDREIAQAVYELGPSIPWVTLSGGNPLVHDLTEVVERLHEAGFKVAVETQATLWKTWVNMCDLVTMSPKPPSSHMKTNWPQLHAFVVNTVAPKVLKLVVGNMADFEYAVRIRERYRYTKLYLQPCNPNPPTLDLATSPEADRDDLLSRLTLLTHQVLHHETLGNRYYGETIVLPQLHVLMYGNRRGV